MGGTFHYYSDAARALWDMPSEELYSLARGQTDAMQRAAQLTLRLKAEFVTPESFRDERSVLTRLASALSTDPEFPIDLAMKLGRGRSATAPPSEDIQWVTRRSRRSVVLWVAVVAAVSLLVLDVLATAGVPVPTPIGDFLDRVTGEDVTPQTPAPPPSPSDTGTNIAPRELLIASTLGGKEVAEQRPTAGTLATRVTERSKNENYQNGKERNYQSGRALHYQNGKDRYFQKGRNQDDASSDRSKRSKVRSYALERASSAQATGRTTTERSRKRRRR